MKPAASSGEADRAWKGAYHPAALPVKPVDGTSQGALPDVVKGVDHADHFPASSVKPVDHDGQAALPPPAKLVDPDVYPVAPSVKPVDRGSKRALPKLDSNNKTQSIPAAAAVAGIDLVRVKAVDQAVAAFERRFNPIPGETPPRGFAGLARQLHNRAPPEGWRMRSGKAGAPKPPSRLTGGLILLQIRRGRSMRAHMTVPELAEAMGNVSEPRGKQKPDMLNLSQPIGLPGFGSGTGIRTPNF